MRSMNSQEIADAEKSHSRLVKMSNREREKKNSTCVISMFTSVFRIFNSHSASNNNDKNKG